MRLNFFRFPFAVDVFSCAVTMEYVRRQVGFGFERRNERRIVEIFAKFSRFRPNPIQDVFGRYQAVRPCSSNCWYIFKDQFQDALSALDVDIRHEELNKLFIMFDLDDNRGLDLFEFKMAIKARTLLLFIQIS